MALVTVRVPKMLILTFVPVLDTQCQLWAISKIANMLYVKLWHSVLSSQSLSSHLWTIPWSLGLLKHLSRRGPRPILDIRVDGLISISVIFLATVWIRICQLAFFPHVKTPCHRSGQLVDSLICEYR